jgi:hypothetical protein
LNNSELNNRPEKSIHGFIYVATRSDGLVKVGITLDPDKRKRQLENASGLTITKFFTRWAYNPGGAERYVFEKWAEFRKEGEWFSEGIAQEIEDYLVPRTNPPPPT